MGGDWESIWSDLSSKGVRLFTILSYSFIKVKTSVLKIVGTAASGRQDEEGRIERARARPKAKLCLAHID